jgi:hypothetical protein
MGRKAVWLIPSVKHRAVTWRSICTDVCTDIASKLERNDIPEIFYSTTLLFYQV